MTADQEMALSLTYGTCNISTSNPYFKTTVVPDVGRIKMSLDFIDYSQIGGLLCSRDYFRLVNLFELF
jgi:hypothetical protein